jgi:hypothetical protein
VTPLAIGALLAAGAMVWVIAPIFSDVPDDFDRSYPPSIAADDAAEAAIRRWKEQKE